MLVDFPAFARYSFQCTMHRGQSQAEWTSVPGSVPRWFNCPKMVTYLGTIRAGLVSNYVDQVPRVATTVNWQSY